MSIDSTGNPTLTPAACLDNALNLLGHNENTMPVHSSNLLHALEMFSASSGDTALEKAVRTRIDTLRETIAANQT